MKRRLSLALLLLVGCDRSAKPVNDSAPQAPSAAATPAPVPASSKSGPTPDDPMLANVSPMPIPAEASSLAKGNNTFAFDLWARTSKRPGNAAFSPASISIAMAMTWLGASGETSAQIKKTMHFDGAGDAEAWGKFGRAMSTPPRALKLRIANRLFGEQSYKFEQPYLDKTKEIFGAPLETVDFKKAYEPARAKINGWVEDQTEKRIANLLPAGALDELTRLVLVNAIYFLADWANPFEKTATHDEPFDVSPTVKKNVPTMHEVGHFGYAQEGGAKILELPYKNNEASMLIVLPDAKDGIAAVEKSFDAKKLESVRKALAGSRVAVSLPRFQLEPETMPLGTDLMALGMPLAFDKEKADFSAMAKPADPRERLYIAKVFHKAFVKVDEKGTEAAAATAVVMAAGGAAPSKPLEFKADHPFLFFIVEKTSGIVLFMGRVSDPSAT
jgi:serpin B